MAVEKAAESDKTEAVKSNGGRWRLGGVVLVAVVLIAGFLWFRSRGKEATDDAQVDGHITQIAPRVGGTLTKVHVTNNQAVKAGEVLAEIDPRDYQNALDRARARC